MAFALLQLVCSVGLSFFIVESPLWLLNKGDILNGKRAIRAVCKVNGILD